MDKKRKNKTLERVSVNGRITIVEGNGEKRIYKVYKDESTGFLYIKSNTIPIDTEIMTANGKVIHVHACPDTTKKKNNTKVIKRVITAKSQIKKSALKVKEETVPRNDYCSCILTKQGKKYVVIISDTGNSILQDKEKQIINAFSEVGKTLLIAIANDDKTIKYGGEIFILSSYIRGDAVFVDQYKRREAHKYNKEIKNVQAKIVNNNSEYVYVYYKLNNLCITKNHDIDTVTFVSNDAITRREVRVNAYYCKECKRYFIDYDAVKGWFDKKLYPCLKYHIVGNTWGDRKPVSELMMYGYNVKEGVLSEKERQRLLGNIIQMKLMSKADIIQIIQNNIDFNGKKPGNEKAKERWKADIKFVHEYVCDNKTIINGKLCR